MDRPSLLILALAALTITVGCASQRPFSDADDGANALAEGTPAQVGVWLRGMKPATLPVAGGDLLPLTPVERRFEWTLNGESRGVIRRIDVPEGRPPIGGTFSWLDAESGALLSSQRFSLTNSGAWLSSASVNADREVESRFKPPLTILDAQMHPGVPSKTTHEVLVADMDRPGRITHRGRATSSIELIGENTIVVADREAPCVVIRTSFDAQFGPAVVKRISYLWYEPGVGLVAEYADERVRTLGIETDVRKECWIALD